MSSIIMPDDIIYTPEELKRAKEIVQHDSRKSIEAFGKQFRQTINARTNFQLGLAASQIQPNILAYLEDPDNASKGDQSNGTQKNNTSAPEGATVH